MKKFKISGIGLDLRNPGSKIYGGDNLNVLMKEIDYVLLDIMSCKENLTHDFTEDMVIHKLSTILATLDFSKIPEDKENNKSSINLATDLILEWKDGYWTFPVEPEMIFISHLPIEPEKGVAEKVKYQEDIKELKKISKLGLFVQDPSKGLEELENWNNTFGEYPQHVLRPISLLQYDKDLEDKLKETNATTWGVNYYGDELSKETEYQAFGNSFLLSFAAYHSSVVLLPVRDGVDFHTTDSLKYLEECLKMTIDGSSSIDPKFEMKKSISRLVKPPKKIIEEGVVLGNDWVVPGSDSELQYMPEEVKFFFGKAKEDYTIPDVLKTRNLTEYEKTFKDIISNYYLPDNSEWRDYCWRVLSLVAVDFISKHFTVDQRWSLDILRVGKYSMIIKATQTKKKNWWNKRLPDEIGDVKTFLACLGNTGNIFFVDTQEDMDYIVEITKNAPLE